MGGGGGVPNSGGGYHPCTKLGTWVHLGKAYLAPYEAGGWGALCTCSARASVLNASFSRGSEGHTGGATDPRLTGPTHIVPT